MASGFLKDLKNFCCCIPKTDDDTEHLVGNENDSDWISATRIINQNRHSTNGIPTFAAGSSNSRGLPENLSQPAKSQNEAEEDALNKILDRTQQSIIDVTNLDNSPMDIDVLQRARLYSEAIKRHDAEIEKKTLASIENFPDFVDQALVKSQLLTDVGTRAAELLNQSEAEVLSAEEFLWLSKGADLFNNAFRLGAQIECKEELIAYMSLDD